MRNHTFEGVSGSSRVPRLLDVEVGASDTTLSILVPDRSRTYKKVRVDTRLLAHRLQTLTFTQERLPGLDGNNDIMVCLNDNEVWLWIRTAGKDDGGADIMVAREDLNRGLDLGNA
jgi:hypothetical protein